MALPRRNGGVLLEFQPMSPEEIERTVQFLLHQQAKFAADFDKQSAKTDRMTEAVLGLTSTVGRVTDDVGQLAGGLGQLTDGLGQLADRVAGVADGLIGLTRIVGRVTERLEQLAKAQQLTDQQLKETNKLFEPHLREDHGHRPS